MILQAFIDDSGSEPKSPIFVLAGFIASAEQWATFSNEWQKVLDLPPKLKYFKMSEANNLTGEFHRRNGWTDQKRDDRLVAFVRVIQKYAQIRLSVSVNHDLFEKYVGNLPATVRTLATDKPYNHLASNLIVAAAERLAKRSILTYGPVTPCDFIFDQQKGYADDFLLYWPGFKNIANTTASELKDFIGSTPIFRNDQDFLPLQAADLYAWQVRNNYIQNNQVNNQTIIFLPSLALNLLLSLPSIERHIDEQELANDRDRLISLANTITKNNPLVRWIKPGRDKTEQKRLRAEGRKNLKSFVGEKDKPL